MTYGGLTYQLIVQILWDFVALIQWLLNQTCAQGKYDTFINHYCKSFFKGEIVT